MVKSLSSLSHKIKLCTERGMNIADRAEELFRQGYNCSQSVFAAFSDLVGMTTEEV